MNTNTVQGIMEEIQGYLGDADSLKLAQQFGLDAPERISLVTRIILIKEQRETNELLTGLLDGLNLIFEKVMEQVQAEQLKAQQVVE